MLKPTTAELKFFRELGKRLRHRRIQCDWKQTTFAEKIGISTKTLARMEAGEGSCVALQTWFRAASLLDEEHLWMHFFEPQEDFFEALERQERQAPEPKRVRRSTCYR